MPEGIRLIPLNWRFGMKKIRTVTAVLLITILITAFGCSKKDGIDTTTFLHYNFPFYLGEELVITEAFLYSGELPYLCLVGFLGKRSLPSPCYVP